ncbi:hypothetical protein [Flavobacterium aurantiibacter]|uniref:Uncharacterized protein n=1 Tax=Flavobacterium aurantiibacter TaxID=2023067 RepID=A0A255ZY45_9FLAO|nr:hypothetical protein [Flavobacterium aurantiibacter]OYQ46413.1 hypothetical protein CHX27_04490 [Flavobacterium aurantiibacter]
MGGISRFSLQYRFVAVVWAVFRTASVGRCAKNARTHRHFGAISTAIAAAAIVSKEFFFRDVFSHKGMQRKAVLLNSD